MVSTQFSPAVALKGCAVICLIIVGGCFGLAVIGSLAGDKDSPEPSTAAKPVQPEAILPAPVEVAALTPGQMYQVSQSVPLLPAMSKLDTVRNNAWIIPAGGYFRCVQREMEYGGNWYSAQIFDGAGNTFNGFIDGEALAKVKYTAYVPEAYRAPSAIRDGQVSGTGYEQTGDMVYVAPEHGKRYHAGRDCRGLNKANRVVSVSRSSAEAQGYSPCQICRPR